MQTRNRVEVFRLGPREWERLRARSRTRNNATSAVMLALGALAAALVASVLYAIYWAIAATAQALVPQSVPSLKDLASPTPQVWRRYRAS